MDNFKQTHLKNLNPSLFLFLLFMIVSFIVSPSSSSPSSSNHQTGVPEKTEINLDDKSRYRLVYVKKTTPFVTNHRRQDHHFHRHRENRYARYFKMNKNRKDNKRETTTGLAVNAGRKKRPNRPVGPAAFSVMLPKGFVPPSGSSTCHNQNPNVAATSFCDLSVSRKP